MANDKIKAYEMFNKPELLEIAEELNVVISSSEHVVSIIRAIHGDLMEHGIPSEEECSQLLDDYLYNCGYIDDDGAAFAQEVVEANLSLDMGDFQEYKTEIIETAEDDDTVFIDEDTVTIGGDVYDKPSCFTLADERDPACNRCKVFDVCLEERIIARPPCYGKKYSATSDVCMGCMEKLPCSEIVLKE